MLQLHAPSPSISTHAPPLRVGAPLDEFAFRSLRQKLLLDCCKWNPQVGDVETLARFPLILQKETWHQLASWAESLAAEASEAEAELLAWPALHDRLALPGRIREVLRRTTQGPTPGIARINRFDFHWTTAGWRISECNSDVPGGFTEASSFTQMVARHYPGLTPAGDPTERWCDAMAAAPRSTGAVALLVAPGYIADQQVVAYLSQELKRRDLHPHICDPRHLEWRGGRAYLDTEFYCLAIDAVVRFYQGEWLGDFSLNSGWPQLFRGGITPVSNPGSALLSESKRFPLVWDALDTQLPTWRKLLPETVDPRDANWASDESWLVKGAFSNNGDQVAIRESLSADQWERVSWKVRRDPKRWVAQRRFEPVPIATPMGPMIPCIGLYTVNGRAAGIYGRMTAGPVIDYSATDVAVLIDDEDEEPS